MKSEPIFKFTVIFGDDGHGAETLRAAIAERFPYWQVYLRYSLEQGIFLVAIASDYRLLQRDGTFISRTMPDDQDYNVLYSFIAERTDRPKQMSATVDPLDISYKAFRRGIGV